MTDAELPIQGFFDGLAGGELHGWAWRPDQPDLPVTVQITANGRLLGEVQATQFRPDVRDAGIGHGRYGFSVAFDRPVDIHEVTRIVARVKDGPLLACGEIDVGGPAPAADRLVPAFQAFVASVLGRSEDEPGGSPTPRPGARVNFIVYGGLEPRPGEPERGYGPTARAFAAVLAHLGTLHLVADPAAEVDAIHCEHLARGETSLFLSFAPPHRTVLGLRCPTVPVIGWGFPTLPSAVWDDERRHDWRWVLRQTGRAIALSGQAAHAVKASMGADFPVVAIPAPLWDRGAGPFPLRALDQPARLSIDGHVLDTRGLQVGIDMAFPPPPPATLGPTQVEVDGVVFTSVVAPRDGHAHWMDITSAFIAALGAMKDATLVLRIVDAAPDYWWWPLLDLISRAPPFAGRIVVLDGVLSDEDDLVAASHWVVNASSSEAFSAPLAEFMCAGRPAVAPRHTAMADHVDPACALVVDSDEEPCSWPQDSRHELATTRHPVTWSSLRDRLAQAYDVARRDRPRHEAMSRAAALMMKGFCSDEVVADKLDLFLGLCRHEQPGAPASDIIAATPPA